MNRLTDEDVTSLVQRFFQDREQDRRVSIDAMIADAHGGQTSTDDIMAVAARITDEFQARASRCDEQKTMARPSLEPVQVSDELPEVEGYDIVDFLGRGGMGNVYEAYQRSTGRRVAMKFLRDTEPSSESMRRRFEREIELVARLQHPAIASVLDAGHYREQYFFVLDYIEGTTLDAAFPPGQCNPREALLVIAKVCDAVEYAHERGVLHRDLKPSNVVVDGDRQPHLLDFGLAKAIDHPALGQGNWTISSPGQIVGTLAYMSPEQSRGDLRELSLRSDIYSIGVIAYEMIAGRLPCEVDGPLEKVLNRITKIPPPIPSSLQRMSGPGSIDRDSRPDVRNMFGLKRFFGSHADLDAILLKTLEKSPRDRYSSARALGNDIRRYLNSENVVARRASSMTRLMRWTRRNQRFAMTITVSLVVIVTVIVGAFLQVARERDRAVDARRIAVRESHNAQASEQHAKREVQVSKTAAVYLADVFRLLDPAGVKGGRVNAREVLENSLAGTDQLNEQPLGKAMVLQAIGTGWKNLGEYERATKVTEKALALRRQSSDVSVSEISETLNELGSIWHLRGDFRTAQRYYRESAALLRQSGSNQRVLGNTLTNLGWALTERAQNIEGEKLIREALTIQRKLFDEPHSDIAMSLNRLGLALNNQKRYSESEVIYMEAIAMHRALFGDDHMLIAQDLENLAGTVTGMGRWDDSLSLFKQSLEMRRRVLPPTHPDIARSLHYYGNMILARHGPAEAKPLLEECVAIRRKVLPPNHPYLAQALALLGDILMKMSDYKGALPLFEESREILAEQLQHYFPDGEIPEDYRAGDYSGLAGMALEPQNLAELAENSGICLAKLGQYEQSGIRFQAALRSCRAIFGPNHLRTKRVQQYLAQLDRIKKRNMAATSSEPEK